MRRRTPGVVATSFSRKEVDLLLKVLDLVEDKRYNTATAAVRSTVGRALTARLLSLREQSRKALAAKRHNAK